MLLVCLLAATADAQGDPAADAQARALDLPRDALPVEVYIAFELTGIQGIDDDSETYEFSGVLTLQWKDERQAFDRVAAGVEEKLYHGTYQFNEIAPSWYPQIMLVGAVETSLPQGILLRVGPDGSSTLMQTVHATVRSRLDLLRFPFDDQRLLAAFRVVAFDEQEVVLVANEHSVTRAASEIWVPQWETTGVRGEVAPHPVSRLGVQSSSSAFRVAVDVSRRSFFMVRLVILPLAIIVMLSWSVFWMDRSSLGDRMSVSFVGLLTAVSYQVLVSGVMPRIASVTFMNAFLSFSFLIMVATVGVNLVVGAMDKRGEIARGDRLDRRCRWGFPLVYALLIGFAAARTLL